MTDSCCDLPAAMAEELALCVLPLAVIQENREYKNYLDNRELDPKFFYDRLRAGSLGSTSAVNAETFKEAMEAQLQAGKDILCIAFSGALCVRLTNRLYAFCPSAMSLRGSPCSLPTIFSFLE